MLAEGRGAGGTSPLPVTRGVDGRRPKWSGGVRTKVARGETVNMQRKLIGNECFSIVEVQELVFDGFQTRKRVKSIAKISK